MKNLLLFSCAFVFSVHVSSTAHAQNALIWQENCADFDRINEQDEYYSCLEQNLVELGEAYNLLIRSLLALEEKISASVAAEVSGLSSKVDKMIIRGSVTDDSCFALQVPRNFCEGDEVPISPPTKVSESLIERYGGADSICTFVQVCYVP